MLLQSCVTYKTKHLAIVKRRRYIILSPLLCSIFAPGRQKEVEKIFNLLKTATNFSVLCVAFWQPVIRQLCIAKRGEHYFKFLKTFYFYDEAGHIGTDKNQHFERCDDRFISLVYEWFSASRFRSLHLIRNLLYIEKRLSIKFVDKHFILQKSRTRLKTFTKVGFFGGSK